MGEQAVGRQEFCQDIYTRRTSLDLSRDKCAWVHEPRLSAPLRPVRQCPRKCRDQSALSAYLEQSGRNQHFWKQSIKVAPLRKADPRCNASGSAADRMAPRKDRSNTRIRSAKARIARGRVLRPASRRAQRVAEGGARSPPRAAAMARAWKESDEASCFVERSARPGSARDYPQRRFRACLAISPLKPSLTRRRASSMPASPCVTTFGARQERRCFRRDRPPRTSAYRSAPRIRCIFLDR